MFDTGDLDECLPELELDEPERRRRVAAIDRAIGETGSHINAAMARLIDDIASFDELGGWWEHGAKTLVEWVAWRLGVTPSDARHHVRVARKLRELPQMAAAFRRSELSYWQVRVMVPCATAAVEAEFLHMARYTTAGQLQRVMGAYKGCLDRTEAELAEQRHTQRSLHYYFDDDGFLRVAVRLSPEEGKILVRALEAAERTLRDELDEETRRTTTVDQLQADALGEVARAALHTGRVVDRASDDAPPSRPVVIPIVAIHVDVLSLLNGTGERCDVDEGPSLASETARRLTCDCSIETLFYGDDGLRDLGRRKRTVSPRMRKALEQRDVTCVFPGCDRTRFCEAHHIVHWIHLGETKLPNLALLCWHHHRLVHEGAFKIQINEDMSFSFFDPQGRLIPRTPVRADGDMTALVERNHQEGLAIDKETCQTQWDGNGINVGDCVHALLSASGKLALPERAPPVREIV